MPKQYFDGEIAKAPRIQKMIDYLFAELPVIEADRAEIVTESYKQTENDPIVLRRAKAFQAICEKLPMVIRPMELIVGSNAKAPRGCQMFPEYSYSWMEAEYETVATREADPFYIADDTKRRLHEAYQYWEGKTTSELATSMMAPEALMAMKHNIFTPGNYFYNGIGHFTVKYEEVLAIGFEGIIAKIDEELHKLTLCAPDYATHHTLDRKSVV